MVGADHARVNASVPVRRPPRTSLGAGVAHYGLAGSDSGDARRSALCRVPKSTVYLLASGPEHPEAFVTWEVRECSTGAIVRLTVDEVDAASGEIEAAWQPVVTTLQALLSAP